MSPPRPPGAMLKPLRAMLTSLSPPTSPRAKAKELHDWIQQLESEKFDLMEKLRRQKYEVGAEQGRLECLGGGVILGSLGGHHGGTGVFLFPSICRSMFCTTASAMPRNCEWGGGGQPGVGLGISGSVLGLLEGGLGVPEG